MVRSFVDPLQTTILEGTIAERLTLAVGVVALVYGLLEMTTLVSYLVDWTTSDASVEILEPTVAAFLGVVVGLVVIVLAVGLDFE